MEKGSRRPAAAAAAASAVLPLPDELIVEILARLPAKSLCLCKCVSRAWRTFISDPTNRRRFAQTLSGLFFSSLNDDSLTWDFIGLSVTSVLPPPPGVDTALSFLPSTCGKMELLDSCNGLLLLRCEGPREEDSGEQDSPPFYIVCNPATREWVTLPRASYYPVRDLDTCLAALGFDPSISPHFHVFQLVQELDLDCYEFNVQAVEIYSSQTGRWALREAPFDYDTDNVQCSGQMTYFKGFLHFCTVNNSVLSVNTEGQTWKISQVRQTVGGDLSTVCHSQGHLLYVDDNLWSSDTMSIYVLEDLESEEWTWVFKQSINKPDLFGPRMPRTVWINNTVAFHPDSDLVFFYDWQKKRLVSYDMKHRDLHVICTLEVHFEEQDLRRRIFPYTPMYSGALPSSSVS